MHIHTYARLKGPLLRPNALGYPDLRVYAHRHQYYALWEWLLDDMLLFPLLYPFCLGVRH